MIFDYDNGWFNVKYLSYEFNITDSNIDKKLNEIHSWILTEMPKIKIKITVRKNIGYRDHTLVKYTFKFTNDADFVAFKMAWL